MTSPATESRPAWKRYLPLSFLIAILVFFLFLRASGYLDFLSFASLRENRELLNTWVAQQFTLALLCYFLIYVVVTACSLPFALLMTITGGFLFGALWGSFAVIFAATIGATIVFIAARSAAGDWFSRRAGERVKKLESGFREDVVSYMLFLRLVPIFPFFLINIAAAIFRVPLRIFFLTTLAGVAPGTFVYSLTGSSLDTIFAAGEDFSTSTILTPKVLGTLIGLALLSLLPIIYRRWKKRQG